MHSTHLPLAPGGLRGVRPKNVPWRAGSKQCLTLSSKDKYKAKAAGQQIRASQSKRIPPSPQLSHSSLLPAAGRSKRMKGMDASPHA